MKSYVVFGCGKFGSSVAKTLTELGNEVLAIDIDFDNVQAISDYVTTAIQCDVLDESATSELGLTNFDAAVIAIGSNLEASIMSTVLSKEADIPYIVAKSLTNRQSVILKKVGADKIIYPERDMGIRVAHNLSASNLMDYIQLSPDHSIVELLLLEDWIGKTIEESKIRNKYNVTILAIEREEELLVDPSPNTILQADDILVLIGRDDALNALEKLGIKKA